MLSHTNVAWEEIVGRVGAIPGLSARLQTAPHFVGTIQSFVNGFLAAPWLNARGHAVASVNDSVFEAMAKRDLGGWQYATARNYLERRRYGIGNLSFVHSGGRLVVDTDAFGLQPQSKSGAQLVALKESLAAKGCFRYNDMFEAADAYLTTHPSVVSAIRHRFPLVFVDECQDTSSEQLALLEKIFGMNGEVGVQWIGDANQAIYGYHTSPNMSRLPLIQLGSSRRFGTEIAAIASPLMVEKPQQLVGGGEPGRVVVIKYDEKSVHSVVARFRELAASESPAPGSEICVLGSRWFPGSSQKFPQSLACYSPSLTRAPSTLGSSWDFLYDAQASWRRGDRFREVHRLLMSSIWQYGQAAHLNPPADVSSSTLLVAAHADAEELRPSLNILLVQLLSGDLQTSDSRRHIAVTLDSACELLGFKGSPDIVSTAWEPKVGSAFLDPTGVVDVVVKTVHAAKGETHFATLLVDCLDGTGKKYDLSHVWPLLSGAAKLSALPPKGRTAVKLAFVAATRPMRLLAFACHADRLTISDTDLVKSGWEIVDVRAPI
ncbi:hypothetical protein GCM10022197_26280 [Microlunatus spumicola]|uniref:UvrD-like helicase ATP-binding domain-containing protein n=1 Tax=Microlunatus spumicola TaxID=81499 RepID=A0ABP6XLG1_9ACTN